MGIIALYPVNLIVSEPIVKTYKTTITVALSLTWAPSSEFVSSSILS